MVGSLSRIDAFMASKYCYSSASTTSCERGFSQQNAIKNNLRNNLSLETLDALMLLSLNASDASQVSWKDVFDIWIQRYKDKRAMQLE